MIKDSRINASTGCTVAFVAWVVAVVCLALLWAVDDRRIAATGLFFTGIAVTATVRTYFVDFSAMVRHAFELDAPESVTSLPRRRT